MRLIAELSMPNRGSWNGQWSGSNNRYTIIFATSANKKNREYIGSYYYNFGDGWTARVNIREAESKEKVTNQFCGYEWMVTSIKIHKEIKICR